VRVLSRVPASRFVRTAGHENVSSLPEFLDQQGVRYVVFMAIENSLPTKLTPPLGRAGPDPWPFKLVRVEPSPWGYGPDVWLYQYMNARL
jgi:hypothetical protein